MAVNGIRIQKVLSEAGILSRRKAEEYIKAGRIKVNGHPAQPGQPVNVRADRITIDGVAVNFPRTKTNVYYMLYKPRGFVTTMQDELGRKCVAELVKDIPQKVYPVGRLDKDSEGLILFTNDGAFANTIMHPRNQIGKTYRVTIHSVVNEEKLLKLATGVELEDGKTAPAQVHVLETDPHRTVLQITIFEGKNRQIRRMCEAVNMDVARLKRISVGPQRLGMLAPGKYRELKISEVTALRNAAAKGGNRSEAEVMEAAVAAKPARKKPYENRKPADKKTAPRKNLKKQ